MEIHFKKLSNNSVLPKYNFETDLGIDFFASEDFYLPNIYYEQFLVPTGVAFKFSDEYLDYLKANHKKAGILLRDTSGNAAKRGVAVLAGVIDQTYRGEIKVIMKNLGDNTVNIKAGDKIAQGLIIEMPDLKIAEVFDLDETDRGQKGFGESSGVMG